MSTAAPTVPLPPISPKPRTRVNWTPAERVEWLALFEKSGQSVSEFCRANDLPSATLSLWRQQQAAASGGADGGELIEIDAAAVLGPGSLKPWVTIRIPGDIALEVAAEADTKWLGTLVKHLTARGA